MTRTMSDDSVDFKKLEKEFSAAVAADAQYQRENDAKFRAIHQKVATYEEFRDIVKASHLKPLDRKDIFTSERKQPWNSSASRHGSEPRLTDALLATRTNTLPETANEFNRQWRQCETSQDKSSLLLHCGGKQLLRIFKTEISFGLMGDMMMALNKSFESDQSGTVVEVLDALSQTGRFSLTCQFLSSAEKAEISSLLEKLESTVGDGKITKLRLSYLGE